MSLEGKAAQYMPGAKKGVTSNDGTQNLGQSQLRRPLTETLREERCLFLAQIWLCRNATAEKHVWNDSKRLQSVELAMDGVIAIRIYTESVS